MNGNDENWWNKLGAGIKNATDETVNFFEKDFVNFWEKDFVNFFTNTIGENTKNFFEQIGSEINKDDNQLKGVFSEFGTKIRSELIVFVEKSNDETLKNAMNSIGEKFEKAFMMLGENIVKNENAEKEVDEIITKLKEEIKTDFEKIKDENIKFIKTNIEHI